MAKKNGGVLSPNPYNEGGSLSDDKPDSGDLEGYTTYDECSKMQLSQEGASLMDTPNSRSGEGIMGGVAPGEPNPFNMSTTAQSKRGK